MYQRELPARPNLEHLKKQARQLQRGHLRGEAEAIDRFRAVGVDLAPSATKLADALHVIAREYGFDNWTKLKTHVEMLADDPLVALTAAISANDAGLVRMVLAKHPVLKNRINESLPNYGFDEPAILAAVHKNNREMIEALLAAGANINERSKWWAGSFGVLDFSRPGITEFLIERGATIDVHAAARLGLFDRVKALVEADPALVRARGGDGQTPLHFAATVEIAEYLLAQGAEIDERDIDHESTAAQYMVGPMPQRPEVAGYLVARGAEADLFVAAAVGDLELVRRRLDDDPDAVRVSVSEKDFPKQDPRSGGSIYIFSFGWGKTPHMVARDFGHEDVFRLLMERSPLDLRLAQACEANDDAIAEELLGQHPKTVDSLSDEVARRIVSAAVRNNARAVEMMLNAGWPVGVRGEKERTALHWACWHGNAEMARVLVEHGAPLTVQEAEYKGTPLDWAIHGAVHGWRPDLGEYPATVKRLLVAGAKAPENVDALDTTEEVREVLRQHQESLKS